MRDILIVGGGIIGLMSAYYLRQAGFTITLLEQGQCGQQSSWAGGGICSPLYPWRHQDTVSHLLTRSQQLYPGLVADLHVTTQIDSELLRSGLLILDPKESQYAQHWAVQHQIPLTTLTAYELSQRYPHLGVNTAALWLPEVMQIRNPRLLQALVSALTQDKGVEILTQHAVTDWICEGKRVSAAVTAQGRFSADKIVIAAGAWSGKLLNALDIQSEIEPVKGQMLLFQAAPQQLQEIVLFHNHYLIPRQDGLILAGSTMENADFDTRPTAAAYQALYKDSIALLPALADAPVVAHWTGLRPGGMSEPIIGPLPAQQWDNLYLNTGHFRMGLALAPASAEKLVQLLI